MRGFIVQRKVEPLVLVVQSKSACTGTQLQLKLVLPLQRRIRWL